MYNDVWTRIIAGIPTHLCYSVMLHASKHFGHTLERRENKKYKENKVQTSMNFVSEIEN